MDIRDRVLARRDLDQLRALRDLDGLAAALNAENVKVRQPNTFVTWRAVITRCSAGKAIRNKMEAAAPQDSAIKSACEFLSQEAGLDVGDPGCWLAIDGMVQAGVMSVEEGQQLKDLSMKHLTVGRLDVEAALYNTHNDTEK
jgi:hypothetical protein